MQNIYNRKPSKITNDQFLVSNLELYSSRKGWIVGKQEQRSNGV